MRSRPTPSEDASIAALLQAYKEAGHQAEIVPRSARDKPDALLQIAGCRVACECIQIPPHYIFQHQHKQYPLSAWRGLPVLSHIYPNEPHQWIATAINQKARLHDGYITATGASEAWLLVHSPVQANQFFVDGAKEWVQWAVRHGSKMSSHPFAQVFLWTPRDGIYPVWSRARDRDTHSALGLEFSRGYPTLCTNQFSVSITTLPAGASNHAHTSLILSDATLISVDPIDTEYRRHHPATRPVQYHIKTRTWPDHYELTVAVEFLDRSGVCEPNAFSVMRLTPATQYWHHVLHEFGAPKTLRTQHAIQHF